MFEDLFQHQIFSQPGYYINSQVPLAREKDNEKACDMAIKFLPADYRHRIFCFAEVKCAETHTYSKIRHLEEQAFGYCLDFLRANPDIGRTYACTLVGASIRCWSLAPGDNELKSFWMGPKGSLVAYMDVGDDRYAAPLTSAFGDMKLMLIDGGAGMPLGMSYEDIDRYGTVVSS